VRDIVVMAALLVLVRVGVVWCCVSHDNLAREACVSAGGTVIERSRCYWTTTCHRVGKVTVCTPYEHCDWKCNAPPPRPPDASVPIEVQALKEDP
jgi:hypothetical protein